MRPIDGPKAFAEAFKVPRETIDRLERYAALLAHWQASTNLVSEATLPELWSRHFADSAQLVELAPKARLWLDLGSGAGFPGLVVGLLRSEEPGLRMHLVEKSAKKCAFLAEVVRATKARVEIHAMRIEQLSAGHLVGVPEVISARALAPLPDLLRLAAPLFDAHTTGLFLKGREAAVEIEAARSAWDFDVRPHRSLTSAESHILELTGLRPKRETRGKA